MLTLTLDMNCLIDLDSIDPRLGTEHVKQIVEASRQGKVDLAICASCASERQVGGEWLGSFQVFKERLDSAGLNHIRLLMPLGRYDVSFFDFCLLGSSEEIAAEEKIFRILFPNTEPAWAIMAEDAEWVAQDQHASDYAKWRNKICDAQAYWAHKYARRDIFITADGNFSKRFKSDAILSPAQASAII